MTDHKDIVERVVGEMRASSWSCGPRCESMSTLQDDADFQRWADLIEAQASRIVELEEEIASLKAERDGLEKRVAALQLSIDDEEGWLIELAPSVHGVPAWIGEELEATESASKAIRFCRKQDADAVIHALGWTEAFATDHVWTSPRALTAIQETK